MANDTPHKQEFRIRDLSTRSVILFPTRAQIIRDIKEITLHPGPNQIIIDGLAPTVDEHSIKVEGTGSATITEVSVDLLQNREIFEEIYPSDSEDEEDDEEDESEVETSDMKTVNDKIKKLQVQVFSEQETINSGAQRLIILDTFGKSVEKNPPAPDNLDKLITAYRDERDKIYKDHELATAAVEKLQKDIASAEKEKVKLVKAMVKAKEKTEKAKMKEKQKKARKDAEKYKEKMRIKAEREQFWPKKVFRITISLEPTILTPGSSRRSSIAGDTMVNVDNVSTFHEAPSTPLKTGDISLSLSYITYSASWSPRYDMSLNSVKSTGILEYGAELKNTTSEVWRDAKIVLSTSQTTFSGLSETIPLLQPWHVRLLKGGRNPDSALFSDYERLAKQKEWSQSTGETSQKPRGEIFGRDNQTNNAYFQSESFKKKARVNQQVQQVMSSHTAPPQASALFGFGAPPPPGGQTRSGGMFGGGRGGGLFSSSAPSNPAPTSHLRHRRVDTDIDAVDEEAEMDSSAFDLDEMLAQGEQLQILTFEEGAWEETGMSTSYDVPGLKTLAPNNSTSKHKIAKIDFKNIIFSHIVIGKLRQVAFLKARLRNTSKITLLKGPLGLTLDGSFLGQGSFPRCSSGESFSLPLGVDPAITIAYPKPTVRRSQSGIFNKEDSNVFTRSVVITNTKPNAAIEITVLDQVPVSEDERLRIDITSPRGLKPGGEGVRTGSSAFTGLAPANTGLGAKGTAKDVRASVYGADGNEVSRDGKWGSAIANTKKGGEVSWNVKLNPGQGVKLVLEYEASFPAGETMVGVHMPNA